MIIEFYGKECPHCIRMEPILRRLKEEGVEIQEYEVWHNEKNAKKMDEYDKGRCGGVPFFVNPETGKFVCGEAPYEELKKIA